jgi:diguanylate cyclase (GGDEF)-like protein
MKPSLRYFLLLVLLALQISTLVAILLSSRANTEIVLRDHAREVMGHLATTAADNSKRFLSPAERAVRLSEGLLEKDVLTTAARTELESYFIDQLRTNSELAGIYLGQDDGSFFFVKREGEGFLTKNIDMTTSREVTYTYRTKSGAFIREERPRDDSYDPRQRPWYQKALVKSGQIWTEPYMFFTSKRPGITAAQPVYKKDGGLLGVVGVDIEITGLSAFLDEVPISANGSAFMMNREGTAIAFPGIQEVLELDAEEKNLPHIDEIGGVAEALVAGFSSQQLALLSRKEFVEFQMNDKPYYGMLSPFKFGDATWLVGVYAPSSDFMGHIQSQNQRYVWQILGIGFLSCLLAIPLVFGFTRPIVNLYEQATRDALTKLPNRTDFLKRAEAMSAQARRSGQQVALAMLDLDGFKQVNDRYGHKAGDVVLEVIAKRMAGSIRSSDLVGRYGGDEFAICLLDVDAAEASYLIERIRESIQREPVRSKDEVYHVGASAGVTIMQWGEDVAQTLERADQALLEAKAAGKNCTQLLPLERHGMQAN